MGRQRLNRTALGLTVAGLTVPAAAEALVTLAQTLAMAVDGDPGNAALAKEYRATLVALTEACTADDSDDGGEVAEFLRAVQTPMGDTA